MSKIAVVFWSGTGNTEAMANAVAEGAASKGAEVETIQAADFSATNVSGYDALAFGCPAMGSEELEEGEFQPMGANFGIVPPLGLKIKDKRDRYAVFAQRGLDALEAFFREQAED